MAYAELNAETDRVARSLIALGIQPGENVALWMTNRPEWLFVMFAVARVGACLVPLIFTSSSKCPLTISGVRQGA